VSWSYLVIALIVICVVLFIQWRDPLTSYRLYRSARIIIKCVHDERYVEDDPFGATRLVIPDGVLPFDMSMERSVRLIHFLCENIAGYLEYDYGRAHGSPEGTVVVFTKQSTIRDCFGG